MEKNVREPKQQRSIKKKEKIIQVAYDLFSEKGYYRTITSDIAKRAGVSTGIVYGYFEDKRDILFYVLKIYIKEMASPVMDYVNSIPSDTSLIELFNNVLDITENMHRKNANLHNILHSVASVDSAVNDEFLHLEQHITESVTQKLSDFGLDVTNAPEKIHIALNLIQSYSHEVIYDKHDYLDYSAMRKGVIDLLVKIFA